MKVMKWPELEEVPSFTNPLMRLPKPTPPSDQIIKNPEQKHPKQRKEQESNSNQENPID